MLYQDFWMKRGAEMKLTVEQQKQLIPDESVKTRFMERADISKLPAKEKEIRWRRHLAKMDEFRKFLSTTECAGIL
jgi:hypothetical protein